MNSRIYSWTGFMLVTLPSAMLVTFLLCQLSKNLIGGA